MYLRKPAPAILCGVAALSLLTGACATKKHVREAIAPVQQRVDEVGKKTDANKTSIGDLDRNVANLGEKTMEADRKAVSAGQSADKANQAAGQAQQTAGQAQQTATSANSLAQQSIARAGKIEDRINNLDNYKLITTEKIYFRVGRSDLTKEDKTKLDQAFQSLQNMKNYVIEIAGYTDRTGGRAQNLELSRRRADSVVRYLTIEHNVPLRRIHDVGAGSEFPDADNKTRAARKENRRVDIKVYGLEGNGGMNQTTPTGS